MLVYPSARFCEPERNGVFRCNQKRRLNFRTKSELAGEPNGPAATNEPERKRSFRRIGAVVLGRPESGSFAPIPEWAPPCIGLALCAASPFACWVGSA
jgi:hypothetical protein